MTIARVEIKESFNVGNFRLGRWQHYKGGMYTAVGLVTHHETRQKMVLYLSDEHPGEINCRPLLGWPLEFGASLCDPDGWLDMVKIQNVTELPPQYPYWPRGDGRYAQRFRYVENEP